MNRRSLIILSLMLAFAACPAGAVTPRAAPAPDPETALKKLLQRARESGQVESRVNQDRLQAFRQKRDEQAALLKQAKQALQDREHTGDVLEEKLRSNEKELTQLETQLNQRLGNFGELFGVARQVAGDTRAQIENSLISAQYPGREKALNEITANKELPTIDQLRNLWATLLQEQVEQGKVAAFTAMVNDVNGRPQQRRVVRLGPFTAVSGNKYLTYSSETRQLSELNRQPGVAFTRAAAELDSARPGKLVKAAIDPSSGTILGMLVQTPGLMERVRQGGLVGYVVIGLAILGLLIGLERVVVLWITSVKVKRQAQRKEPSRKNPLGRVLMAYADNSFVDVETLELKLDDAILKEIPRLERGLGLVKVLAGVAPLLGLLGTVTGMILTFQAITLWGTGDPKIMAGGISQALITTVLGLIAAIPLLLLHSLANGRARLVQQVLEEHSAGLVAAQAEKRPA